LQRRLLVIKVSVPISGLSLRSTPSHSGRAAGARLFAVILAGEVVAIIPVILRCFVGGLFVFVLLLFRSSLFPGRQLFRFFEQKLNGALFVPLGVEQGCGDGVLLETGEVHHLLNLLSLVWIVGLVVSADKLGDHQLF